MYLEKKCPKCFSVGFFLSFVADYIFLEVPFILGNLPCPAKFLVTCLKHPCRSVISIKLLYRSVISVKLLCNFIKITLRHRCSPVNWLHIFRTSFPKKTPGRLLPNQKNKSQKLQFSSRGWMTWDSNIYLLFLIF